jgi:prepilin-type N-terminal cleavage/methylation domain-containing protein
MSRRRAFTLIELLVVIAIISLLVSILLPSLAKARRLTRLVICSTNVKNLSQTCVMYAAEYDGILPYAGAPGSRWTRWWQKVEDYMPGPEKKNATERGAWKCPLIGDMPGSFRTLGNNPDSPNWYNFIKKQYSMNKFLLATYWDGRPSGNPWANGNDKNLYPQGPVRVGKLDAGLILIGDACMIGGRSDWYTNETFTHVVEGNAWGGREDAQPPWMADLTYAPSGTQAGEVWGHEGSVTVGAIDGSSEFIKEWDKYRLRRRFFNRDLLGHVDKRYP